MKIAAVKGMRDLLPGETWWFQRLEAAAREVFGRYNFDEIRTPVVEATELFQRAVGEETDIVGKEMYTFADRDGASLTLRPEATASAVRAYVEHRMWERPGLTKLYYMGPMFRRERPQKGRYRQFYQIGAEVMGGDAPWIDYELLAMLRDLLRACGIEGAELVINSVGCAEDRPLYHAALRAALEEHLPRMCADCQRRARTNPLRVLDCKVPEDQPIIASLPTMPQFLDPKCRAHFEQVCKLLEANRMAYRLDPRLVRGLDYYTSTAFEFVHGALGAQNALLGGGRYDGLAQALGAPKEAGGGIGFALGEDRFVLAMQAAQSAPQSELRAVIVPLTAAELEAGLRLAAELREAGVRVEMGGVERKLGRALERAAKLAPYALLVGAEEAAAGEVQMKDLRSGEQRRMAAAALPPALRAAGGA